MQDKIYDKTHFCIVIFICFRIFMQNYLFDCRANNQNFNGETTLLNLFPFIPARIES